MKHYAILSVSLAFLLGFSNFAYADALGPIPYDQTADVPDSIPDDEIADELDAELPIALSPQELTAFALYESMMNIVNAKINASSCFIMRGKYQISLFTVGVAGQRRQNNRVAAQLPGHTVNLHAFPDHEITELGSGISVNHARLITSFDYESINKYRARYTFDPTGTTISMTGNLELRDYYSVTHIFNTLGTTNFNRINSNEIQEEYATNTGWGMSSVSGLEYPHSKYWERIKFQRHSNDRARTILVRDLLTLPTSCRITIDTMGYNNTGYISQQGHITIGTAIPGDTVSEFNQ